MNSTKDKIAVIGIACRFPGAVNKDEYWENLITGRETIKHFTDDELSIYEYDFESCRNNPDYVKARGVLDDVDKFDAEFFGITPREAEGTDPQHRVWLETAWQALEDAGCDPYRFKGAIGVFAGKSINTYLINNILRDPGKLENYIRMRSSASYQIMTGNDISNLPTRTAYQFDLRGPAINVQTACSTSLVAICQACQSLFSYESDACIAGGICISIPQESGYLYQEGAIPSPDGRCRPFDSKARGTVFSNGAGAVILKRAEDAIRDRDHVYAMIMGWALNNDGSNKVSYTAPSVDGQASVITMAQAFAGISPEQIGYVEAHGTATQLGDPIELTALTKTFSAKTGKKQYCGIGSVKSNIGHTDTAAGVASFIKAVLSAYNRIIPPSLNYSAPNPHFNIKNSPFFVQDRLSVWEKDEPLIIGVSSFGIGGTNSHVIIKEHPKPDKNVKSEGLWPELVMLSAKSKQSLEWRKDDLIEFAGKHPDTHLGDISFTLRTGRSNMPYRSFCVVNDLSGIKRDAFAPTVKAGEQVSGTAFMFPGQGAQYPGMGRTLYRSDQQFRSILDNFFEIYRTETGSDLMSLMFSDCTPENERLLARTDLTQPAIFIIEYALARLYMDAGIRPRYLIGHSIGEYTAACISGVFDPDQALLTVIKRGRLMQSMPAGCMLAVKCGREHLVSLGSSLFEIAADNSDRQCTISLEFKDLDSVKSLLNTNGIESIRLSTSHAFHSAAFDQVMKEFEDYINSFSLKTPEIPFISCLTGDFITSAQAVSGKYWAQQLRHMVNFRRGVSSIINTENVILLEVGPGTHLTGLARQNKNVVGNTAVIPSLGKDDASGEMHKVIVSIGNLWAHGINAEPEILNRGGIPSKVTLPVYRFQRVRHWIDHFPEPARRDVAANEPKTIHETVRVSSQPENGGITDKLREIVSKVTGFSIDSIREDASFDEMGIDSLSLASFSQNIYRKFHVRIAFRQLATDLNTINLLAKALTVGGAVAAKPARPQGFPGIIKKNALNNFVMFQPNGKKNPLIIVHGERADRFIPEYLGNDQPYFGYIHPGSDGEKIIFKSVEETASLYLDQLLETRPQGPLYIGGYSFGGLVAFEMAVRLCRMGIDVPWVVLFDTTASRDDLQWADDYFKSASVNYLYRNALNVYQLMKSLVCESCIGLNKRVPVKLREFYIIRNYNRLSRKYCPSKFGGRIILFRVRENKSPDQYLGWKEHAGDVTVIPLEGKHDSMFVNSESIKVINSELRKLTGN